MKYKKQADCNCCAVKACKGKRRPYKTCLRWVNPDGRVMLAESALAHPTSLNEALSRLPFECNLTFYLR